MKAHRGESLTSLVRNSALSTSPSTMTKDAALVNILETGVEEISKPCLYNCSNLTINYNPTCK